MMSQFMGPWQINGIYRNEVGWLTKRVNTECRCNIVKQVSRTFPTLFEPLLKYLGYLRLWGYCIFYCFKKVCFSEFQSIVLLFSQFTEQHCRIHLNSQNVQELSIRENVTCFSSLSTKMNINPLCHKRLVHLFTGVPHYI